MYNPLQLALKYTRYLFTAQSGKGHGIHSPFVYDFIWKVLNNPEQPYAFKQVEQLRQKLLGSTEIISVDDFGAGSQKHTSRNRSIGDIARFSAKPAKYARVLYRLVNHYGCRNIIELGTSLGISTAYMALGNTGSRVITCEGSAALAEKSREHFNSLHLDNITVLAGEFEQTLPQALKEMPEADLVFIDGNHRYEPTIRYFNELIPHLHNDSILVFDDIHWSREMEQAWAEIKQHHDISETIDLFFIGIVFFRSEQKVKQHFTIRY
ncbi:MAG: class I SAM-dependent methyltransferase [Dinghuibacter sp.]|nr:class I SAM-dependent methyltransferase [Dinghuibacter sp.]